MRILAAVLSLALAAPLYAADAGELFPEIPGGTSSSKKNNPKLKDPYPVYFRPTSSQIATALGQARRNFGEFATKSKLKLAEMQPEHFHIFTDAPESERRFVLIAVQETYPLLAKRLGIPTSPSLFPGKFPVLIVTQRPALQALADRDSINLSENAIGYYCEATDAMPAHVAFLLPKPEDPDSAEAMRRAWTAALRRELTTALLARYRTARPLPPWLAAGFPAAIAAEAHDDPQVRQALAGQKPSLQKVLQDAAVKPEHLPQYQTLVETLYRKDPRAFGLLVRLLKEGVSFGTALQQSFKITDIKLEQLWHAALAAATSAPATSTAPAATKPQ